MADQINNEQSNFSEVVLGENEIICSLTNRVVKATDKELTLQSMINMMIEEYDFSTSDMERDFKVKSNPLAKCHNSISPVCHHRPQSESGPMFRMTYEPLH